mmetsp:Transcript_14441/g.39134  ORF Transcript_14441/g.39134 Transcript_14441/m.39134 type:complete len:317 (-) Transcript_14441:57-1007(-)
MDAQLPSDGHRGTLLPLHAQLAQLLVRNCVVLEEGSFVSRILLSPWLEALILENDAVSVHHDEFLVTLLLDHFEVAVVELEPVRGPAGAALRAGALLGILGGVHAQAGAVLLHAAQGVGTGQHHDLLVVEAHAVEHLADVVSRCGATSVHGSWEQAILSTALFVCHVLATILHVDLGPTRGFDGCSRGHLKQVCVGDVRVLGLHGLQQGQCHLQTCIVTMAQLRLESDGTVGTSALGKFGFGAVIRAGIMPGQADDDGVAVFALDVVLELGVCSRQLLLVHSLHAGGTGDRGSRSLHPRAHLHLALHLLHRLHLIY